MLLNYLGPAEQHARQALALDPDFARAHAGLSFLHFQSAFMGYSADLAGEIRLARDAVAAGASACWFFRS